MLNIKMKVVENVAVANGVYRMNLVGGAPQLVPGSFVELSVPGFYLRRPFSVAASSEGQLMLIYKVVGKGTAAMKDFPVGMELDVIVGLGNGFDVARARRSALLIGGGLGVAPLYQLAISLKNRGIDSTLCAGFNSANDIFLKQEFADICTEVRYATMDGSCGKKGLVTEQLSDIEYDTFYSCGPLPMLKAVQAATHTPGQLSLEARMGCGYGVCMGCTIPTVSGPKRVCKEGPVFEKEELVW